MPLCGPKDEHSFCFHSSCQLGLRGKRSFDVFEVKNLFDFNYRVTREDLWCALILMEKENWQELFHLEMFFVLQWLFFQKSLIMMSGFRTK